MKINLREMLGRLDLETDNIYDLRNHYDSSKLSDLTKNRLAEALNEKAPAEKFNRILNENFAIDIFPRGSEEYFKLDKVASWLTYLSPNNIYYAVEQTYFDYGQDWKWTTIIAYKSESDSWQAINPKQQESILACTTDEELEEVAKNILRESRLDKGFSESLTEASYGGAYDIEDDMYFTKEELVEFADEFIDKFSDWSEHRCDLEDLYMDDPKHLIVDIYDHDDDVTHRAEINIDMRKIRTPKSIYRYGDSLLKQWKDSYLEYHEYDESLNEEVEEELYKVVLKYGPTKLDFMTGLSEEDAEEIIDTYAGRWIDENGYDWNMEIEEDDESTERVYPFDESLNESIDISDYEELHYPLRDGDKYYQLYRKIENGKGVWAAAELDKYGSDVVGEPFKITYEQARGFEPIEDSSIRKLSRDLGKKLLPKRESLDEQINLPGYAVKYITGYAGNGVNSSETEWFRTEEERDRRVKELKDKNYIGIKTWKMDGFYHTLPKNESLTEGIEDLDSISSTKAKDMSDDDFKILKPLVDEYLKDRKALGDWPDSADERNFVKKWYKLADKCQEIAKNGIKGITGYGRTGDFIKLKVVDLARSVDNTFPWYTRNSLAKFNELESLQEKLNNIEKHDIIKAIVNGEEDDLQTIVDEIYFYDRALYLKLRHFAKKNSLNDKKDYLIKVLQDSLEESLNESVDLSDVEEVKQLNFNNNRVNNLRGIFSIKNLVKALNDTGLDALKIRTSRLKNVSNGDIKDAWYDLRRNGWTASIERDPSLSGFNEVYVFEKIKNESLKEGIEDEVDFYEDEYSTEVIEGSVFIEDGKEWAWVERVAGPIHLDFDNWAVWEAREFVSASDFIIKTNEDGTNEIDIDAFEKAYYAAEKAYFVVDEDTGFIDWGPVETQTEAQDFLNGKVEDWENDMNESLNKNNKLLKEYFLHYDDVGDGREYDYDLDYDDTVDYLFNMMYENGEYPDFLEDKSDEEINAWLNDEKNIPKFREWIEDNLDKLIDKYEYDLMNHFFEDASEKEYEERNRPYEPEYDPMDW